MSLIPQSTVSALGPFPETPISKPSFDKYIDIKQFETTPVHNGYALEHLERKIIKMQGHCPTDIINNLRIRIFQFDPALVTKFNGMTGMYDAQYQDSMGCLIDAMISEQDTIPDLRLKRLITDITKIGSASVHGSVFKLSSGSYPLYVVKIANDPTEDNLAHEAIVGMAAINKLRKKVPNFIHTYGAFMCAPPVLNRKGAVLSWCPSNENPVTYLILENIMDSVSLESLIPNLNDSEFLQIYLQVLNALNVAYKAFDFTHYDLHAGNVLVQILPYYISIPLYLENRILYIKTHYLARIIDYGTSHVTIQGQHFGLYDYESAGVNPNKSFPISDAYKLLLFSYSIAMTKTQGSLARAMGVIYRFFEEPYTLDKRLNMRIQNPRGDYFQGRSSISMFTLDELIEFILRLKLNFITVNPPSDAIATICDNNCVTWDGFLQHVFNQTRLPETLEDYCQAMTAVNALAGSDLKISIHTWLQQFNINTAYDTEIIKMVSLLKKCADTIISFTLNPKNYELYEASLTKFIETRRNITELEVWLASAECSFTLAQEINALTVDVTRYNKFIEFRETINTMKTTWISLKTKIINKTLNHSMDGVYTIQFLTDLIRELPN